MTTEANEFFGIKKAFSDAGYYETAQHKKLYKELKTLIQTSGIYALTGMVGSGKTTLLHRVQQEFEEGGRVIVSQSLTTEKKRLSVATLFVALFYDLNQKEKHLKIPTQGEKRERELLQLIKKNKKPVVLFIDEAHDIHSKTLIALKRLVEMVASKGCKLSIVLAGHPKLGNALSKATIEEIGARTQQFNIDHAMDNKEKYISWLLKQCLHDKLTPDTVITPEAIQRLAAALITPLQIGYYLTKAIQLAYQLGEKPIQPEIIDQVLLPDLDSLEAQLARNGYQIPAVCELLRATTKETKEFLQGKPNLPRRNEFMQAIHSVGITADG